MAPRRSRRQSQTDLQPFLTPEIAPIHRFLRGGDITVEASEERGGLGNVIDSLTESAAKSVQAAKLRNYLRTSQTPVDVSKELKLGNDIESALRSPELGVLRKYIAMTNKGKLGETTSMIETLSARYGDDAVAKALVSAERREDSSPELKALAQQLRSQQLYAWLDSGKSVGDVFKLLKLKNDGFQAFTSQKMLVLDDYIAKFNHHYPEHKTTLLEALTKGFGGESNLVSLLNTAKQVISTMVKAREVEAGMLKQWQDKNLEPANVMKLLHLDQSVTSILTNINLRTFLKYLKKFNENNPTKQETLVGVMASIYGEANVAKAIVSALRAGDTNGVAAKLELQQFKGWMARHLSGEDVFRLLKIRNDDFFRHSRNLSTLDNYIQFINREN